jgi:hypothetical protein
MRSRWLVLAGATLLLPSSGVAQSLFGAGGLGLPLEPLDARTRALGSVGPGLLGPGSLVPVDPAGAASIPIPTLAATMQSSWGSFDRDGQNGDLQGVRFPLISAAYPLGGAGVVSASYGGYFDQRWAAQREGSFELGGTTIPATDRFESIGGVALFRVGWAYRAAEKLSLGASVGRYTGRIDRVFTRQFDTVSVAASVTPFEERAAWTYAGTAVTVGMGFDPSPITRVAASVTWSSDLDAEPREGTPAQGASFDLPLEIRVGASAALTSRLLMTGGLYYADWSGADGGLEGVLSAERVTSVGTGVEWGGPTLIGRTFPLRFGYRRTELPFRFESGDPVESALSVGIGLNLAQVNEFTIAGIDVALERGSRTADRLSEDFWRLTASLKVSGG